MADSSLGLSALWDVPILRSCTSQMAVWKDKLSYRLDDHLHARAVFARMTAEGRYGVSWMRKWAGS